MTPQETIDKLNWHLAQFWRLAQTAPKGLKVNGAVWTNTGNPMLLIAGDKVPVVEPIHKEVA